MKSAAPLSPGGIDSHLDFQLLFEQWELLAAKDNPERFLYHDLTRRIREFPDLNRTPVDPLDLEKDENKLGLGLILGSLFPLSGQEQKKIFGLGLPFNMNPIYATAAFRDQFLDGEGVIRVPENLDLSRLHSQKLLHIYSVILDQIYGIKINPIHPLVFKVVGKDGLSRHYQILLNTQFVKVVAKGALPDLLSRDDMCQKINNGTYDLDKWQQVLPLELFEFYGFILQEAQDLTVPQSIASLNQAVINQDLASGEEFLLLVDESIKSILGRADLKIGVAVMQSINGRLVMTDSRLSYSFLIRQLCSSSCQDQFQAVMEFLSQVSKPVFLKDIAFQMASFPMAKQLLEMGLKEVILYPLRHNGNLVGVLEVCSFTENSFDPTMLLNLDYLAPSLSMALHRQTAVLDQRIQGIIRKNFTAIHPVVAWKFDEIALDYALEEEQGGTPEIKPIIFRDVYPLYGAVDVKDSSRLRNKAIHDDFVIQLELCKHILLQAKALHSLPLLDRILDKIDEFEKRIGLILLSEEEVRITEFFHQELEPIFRHLFDTFENLRGPVKSYFDALDPLVRVINQNRKDFEESLQAINQTISSYLDSEQGVIQSVFPHYFEKFKTDGIEYSIYIGQSLVKELKFDLLYLRNLRLWQLQTFIGISHLIQEKKHELSVPLETTQLILAYTNSISISFRLDERKFDVEGAYNIRYEVIKKRIDKALVKGKTERLTQPGKIAIAYSQQRAADEYGDFIRFFQKKGMLAEEVEELELEEMQGVHGMRALRVSVLPKITDGNPEIFSKLIAERKEG